MKDFNKYYVTFACDDASVVGKVVTFCSELCGDKIDYSLRTNEAVADPSKGKTFSAALLAMKCGKGARLPHWKEDVVIRAQFPDEDSKMTHPYLYVQSRFGCVPWKETYVELFSEEWEIVD